MNELIFIAHVFFVGISCLIALSLGNQALVAFLCIQALLANLFVLKQISFFGFNATAADVYIVGSVLTLNLIQEYFGRVSAQRAIWTSFFLLLFYTIASQFQLWYQPSSLDMVNPYFQHLLQFMPRIMAASMITYLIVQYIDSFTYAFFKYVLHGRYLIVRNCMTILISQLLDTVLFSFLGLYGIVGNLWQIMLVSYCIKIIITVLITPFLIFTRLIIKRRPA